MFPVDPITWLFALARAVHFGACLLALGVFVFEGLILAHARPNAESFIDRRWPPIARLLIFLSLPAALVSAIAWFAFNAITMSGLPPREALQFDNLRIVADTQFGSLWKLRLILLLMTTVAAGASVILRRRSTPQRISTWLALAFSGALAVSLSRSGHGGDGTKLHQIADAMHLLVGAAWPLGLLPLVLLILTLRREPAQERRAATFAITRRFSIMSIASVILLSGSGVANGWPLIGSWGNLTATAYGRTLLVKVGLFLLMVGIGAINRLYLQPRLSMSVDASTEGTYDKALSRLQINVWTEIALGIAVLIAVGLLGLLAPACEQCCTVCQP